MNFVSTSQIKLIWVYPTSETNRAPLYIQAWAHTHSRMMHTPIQALPKFLPSLALSSLLMDQINTFRKHKNTKEDI